MPKFSTYFRPICVAAQLAVATVPVAAAWPERPVTFVVPNPAGGSTDIVARYIAQHLSATLGANFVVENRPGASGTIGAGSVARATPDGYTFLFGTTGQLASVQYLGIEKNYDPVTDLLPVIYVAQAPIAMITHVDLPVQNMRQLMDYARANPGALSYGTPGVATTSHIGGEWFKHLTGLNIVHVPYRGSGPVTNDLVAGHIKLAFDSPVSNLPHIRSGKLRALAVSSITPFAGLPGVPTLKQEGIDMQITLLFGIVAPSGVPKDIVTRLNQAIDAFLQLPMTKEFLVTLGAEATGGSPEAFARFLAEERERWRTMIQTTGIQAAR
jgi:tripartite-type tricarboxylate transporter receptor subunit TctC